MSKPITPSHQCKPIDPERKEQYAELIVSSCADPECRNLRELRHARRSRTLQRVPDRAGTPEAFGVQYGGAPGPQTRSCCGLRAPRSRLRGRGRDNAYHLESRARSSYQLKYLQIRHKEGSESEPRSLGVGSETEERVLYALRRGSWGAVTGLSGLSGTDS